VQGEQQWSPYVTGHEDAVTISDRKVNRVQNCAYPKSFKKVQIFLGFTHFYRQFMQEFLKVCKPITQTLKGDNTFHSGREQEEAF